MAGGNSASGSGQLYYETPVLNIMGREYSTFVDFQKTLSQLGYNSGNVLIRLAYKTTDQTLYEAMDQIGQFFKEVEEEKEMKQAPAATEDTKQPEPTGTDATSDTPMTDAQPEPSKNPEPQASVPDSQEPQSSTTGPEHSDRPGEKDPYRPVNVFLAPSGTTPAAALAPVSETDFTPSIAHAQMHQTRLQEHSRNKRLLSDKELEERAAAQAAKFAAVKSVLIKVRFPDNTSSEWEAGPAETGRFLYQAVRHVMANSDQAFRLVLPGAKTVIQDEDGPKHSLIKGYKLSGRVLVNLVWDDSVKPDVRKQPFLKSSVARQGQAVKVPEVPKGEQEDASPLPAPEPKKEKSDDGGGKKMPKWFKLGKK